MSLNERLASFKTEFESGAAPYFANEEIVSLQRRATGELMRSGAEAKALKVGQCAPIFALPSESGAIVRSDVLLARGPLVVNFYRGLWCPYCNLDLEALQSILPEVEARGATMIALSPQTAVNSRASKRRTGVVFDILTDLHNVVARKFGIVHRLPKYLIEEVHKPLGAELPVFNADESWELPMPGRFVISPNGRVIYSEISADYTQRPEPEALLEPLDKLAAFNTA